MDSASWAPWIFGVSVVSLLAAHHASERECETISFSCCLSVCPSVRLLSANSFLAPFYRLPRSRGDGGQFRSSTKLEAINRSFFASFRHSNDATLSRTLKLQTYIELPGSTKNFGLDSRSLAFNLRGRSTISPPPSRGFTTTTQRRTTS